jgi:hypothetical protein
MNSGYSTMRIVLGYGAKGFVPKSCVTLTQLCLSAPPRRLLYGKDTNPYEDQRLRGAPL